MAHWKEFDHPADIGIEVWAESYTKLVMQAGIAFTELTTDISGIEAEIEHTIVVEEVELDLLLVEFLKELLYLLDTEDFIAEKFYNLKYFVDKGADKFVLVCKAKGGRIDPTLHEIRAEIKAVTYHDLEVTMHKAGKWYARLIFDI